MGGEVARKKRQWEGGSKEEEAVGEKVGRLRSWGGGNREEKAGRVNR